MSSKIRKSVSTRIDSRNGGSMSGDQMPPDGATILSKNVTTSTEEIENGYLITKSVDGYYKTSKGKDNSNNTDNNEKWYNYSKKWYSKTDPLTIKLDNKSLAESFDTEK